jgi:hypothetical protein
MRIWKILWWNFTTRIISYYTKNCFPNPSNVLSQYRIKFNSNAPRPGLKLIIIFSLMLAIRRSQERKKTRGSCGRRTRLPSTRPPPSASSTTTPSSWPSSSSSRSTSWRVSPPWSTMSGPCRWQLELSLSSQLEPSEALWTLCCCICCFLLLKERH